MEFFNGLGKKVNKVVHSVTEKTTESASLARISGELRSLTNECEKLFAEFGKVCYAMQSGMGDPEKAQELSNKIGEIQARMNELGDQRDALKEVRRCPSCGSVQPKEARFCASCGKRLPEDAPAPAPQEDARFCPECGAAVEEGSHFCPVCGQSFGGEDEGAAQDVTIEVQPVVDIDTEEPSIEE